MKNHKITVVTPTYNRAHTLQRVYESLKNQTFKDFKWLIMDDGSTDNTTQLVNELKTENFLEIEYHKNENSKKFYTVFKGIELVKTPLFTILDSDDAYTDNALGIMVSTVEDLSSTDFISATFLSQYPDGEIVGGLFPVGFDGSILEMRYKHKVKGDKHTIFITKPYMNYLKKFDYSIYKGLYAPQKIFFNIYDADGMKSRFVNQPVRIYYQDLNDADSMSADRVKPTSYLGLREGYLSFINSYGSKLWSYPKALIRNLIGYHIYSLVDNRRLKEINKGLKHYKLLSTLLYPVSLIYFKSKM